MVDQLAHQILADSLWISSWFPGEKLRKGSEELHASVFFLETPHVGWVGGGGMARFLHRQRAAPDSLSSFILGSHDLLIVTAARRSGEGALSMSRKQ